MTSRYRDRLILALRSGKYKQAKGGLRLLNTYDPLGVLADILIKSNEIDVQWVKGPGRWYGLRKYLKKSDEMAYHELPGYIRTLTGMSIDEESSLIDLNDRGDTFEEIAKYIEREL